MTNLMPYQFYNRQQLFELLVLQCKEAGRSDYIKKCRHACFDKRWIPMHFDGCTAVPDPLHPFPPCFIHDYGWTVHGGGKQWDIDFAKDCVRFGVVSARKARRWYIGIRIAWFAYFKWKKLLT